MAEANPDEEVMRLIGVKRAWNEIVKIAWSRGDRGLSKEAARRRERVADEIHRLVRAHLAREDGGDRYG